MDRIKSTLGGMLFFELLNTFEFIGITSTMFVIKRNGVILYDSNRMPYYRVASFVKMYINKS